MSNAFAYAIFVNSGKKISHNNKINKENNGSDAKYCNFFYRNRHLDLGDVSASNTAHLVSSLTEDVQGIQVDFDDGHCPTWRNQLQAYHNIWLVVNGRLHGAPVTISTCPVLMLRPRAWNMIEHNILVC